MTSPGCRCFKASSWRAIWLMTSREMRSWSSSLSFSAWRSSTSCLLRSRELWAARRLRFTRSIRRCSFSSSVLARLRGGRLVLGSGSSWPHDFRFFTDRAFSEPGGDGCDGCDVGGARDGVEKLGAVRSSILMVVVEAGSIVGSGVRECTEIMAGVVTAWVNK